MPVTQDQIQALKQSLPRAVENEPLASHANFRIGGPARLYVVADTEDDIVHAVESAEDAGVKWEIIGGGSNILVADKGFDGLIIQTGNRGIDLAGNRISCGAGAITSLVARTAADAGLTGFEWAATVPGTIGGAVFGNAGCFGGETIDAVVEVSTYRLSDKTRVKLSNADCQFGYRDSLFKHERHVILSCVLELAPAGGASPTPRETIDTFIEKRKAEQPFANASAGCMFKNYAFAEERDVSKLREEADVPPGFLERKSIPAGWLVDRAGFKGYRLGKIEVSQAHANFLVNLGGGTADEVAQIVSVIQTKVRDRFGIALKTEVQFLGF